MQALFPKTLPRVLTALLAATIMASAQSEHIETGPEVGERIPAFQAVDQNGKTRSFDDLKGPNGLLLLFYRSADW